MKDFFMNEAIKEARKGIEKGDGGPFGCVVVKDNEIIGRGHNKVLANNDPTAHGEIMAIRDACKNQNTFNLSGCELYTTAEPCPMCFGAILWSRISKVCYGCNIKDTKEIGFDDSAFYEIINNNDKSFMEEFDREKCLKVFEEYKSISTKISY